jgi:hypothetical protein
LTRLFRNVSSYDIYCTLIGEDIEVGKVILSPIRKDNHPTFLLFVSEEKDEIFFKDYAWVGGNVIKFAQLFALYQENTHLNTFVETIRYIDEKMGIGLFPGTVKKEVVRRADIDQTYYASKRVIKFKSRDFTERDIEYWEQYHITKETLDLYNIRSVKHFLNEQSEITWTVSQRTIVFAYVIYNKCKIYRPEESLEFKWRNTCPGHYIQGMEQLKTVGKKANLLITKSLKDVMVFFTFLSETYNIIAPHSETYIFTDKMLKKFLDSYDRVVVVYDFDLAGVSAANRLRKRDSRIEVRFVSTRRMSVNSKMKVIDKDISDFSVMRSDADITAKLKEMSLC